MRSGTVFKALLFILLLCINAIYIRFSVQVDDCGFSLSHPNQFFIESQRILNGGKDIKKESILPETPQLKPSVQKTKGASSALATQNSSLEMDIEGLENYFSEWLILGQLVTLFLHFLLLRFLPFSFLSFLSYFSLYSIQVHLYS